MPFRGPLPSMATMPSRDNEADWNGRDEISNVDVTVEFGLVVRCELALLP